MKHFGAGILILLFSSGSYLFGVLCGFSIKYTNKTINQNPDIHIIDGAKYIKQP